MSKPSIIGLYNEKRGRYVHLDGIPTEIGRELASICREYGVEEAMNVLTKKYTQ